MNPIQRGLVELTATTVPFTNMGSHSCFFACFFSSEPFFIVPIYSIMKNWYHLNLFFQRCLLDSDFGSLLNVVKHNVHLTLLSAGKTPPMTIVKELTTKCLHFLKEDLLLFLHLKQGFLLLICTRNYCSLYI